MNILITGINGFVGSNFTKTWKDNYVLFGLDVNQISEEGVQKIYSWNEVRDIANIDTILHLAGKAHVTEDQQEYQEYFSVNTGLTKIIFDYFLVSDTKKFIFFSSVKAAADSIENEVLTEEFTPNPIGPYAESKKAAEDYILSKLQEAEKRGKQVYIIRPCMIHGPGNKGNLNLLYKVVSRGISWPLGAFDNERSFCSIENIIFVVEEIIKKGVLSGIYNVCDDETLSTNELIRLIGDSVNKKITIWNISKKLIVNTAKIMGFFRLPFNSSKLNKLTENYIVSNEKIKKTLGISKMPVTASTGMKKTLESFK